MSSCAISNFEARLRRGGVDAERIRYAATLQFIGARQPCRLRRAACRARSCRRRTPLDALQPDDEYLAALTQWEAMEEARLMHEISGYMAATASRRARRVQAGSTARGPSVRARAERSGIDLKDAPAVLASPCAAPFGDNMRRADKGRGT